MNDKFTHIKGNNLNMVNISPKKKTFRRAKAQAAIKFSDKIFKRIIEKGSPKGEIFSTARIAGIQAAKKTHHLIPLCHNISLDSINIDFEILKKKNEINVISDCQTFSKTGVEMEAIIAVNIAAITIYDMCKSLSKSIKILEIKLISKSGGKSKDYNDSKL